MAMPIRMRPLLLVAILVGCSSAAPSTSPTPSSLATASPAASLPALTPSVTAGPSPERTLPTPTDNLPTPSEGPIDLRPVEPPAAFSGKITCTGPIGPSDAVALVWLTTSDTAGANTLVMRDYADWTHPRTACEFVNVQIVQLIDSQHVVIEGAEGKFAVVDLPEVAFHWFAVPPFTVDTWTTFIAMSPKLDEVAWLKERAGESATMREIHITTAAGDTVVASLPDQLTGFCGTPLDGSKRGAYSPTGEHLFVLDQGHESAADYSLRVFAGATTVLAVVPPSGGWPEGDYPAMAVWSPTSETLYYRQGNTVWRWTSDDGVEAFLPGVRWSSPTISPNRRHLAYWIPGRDEIGAIYLLDLGSGSSPRLIAQSRTAPVFLNDAQLWYRSSGSGGGCVTEVAGPTIYNIIDGSIDPSIIEAVRGVWPAVSSAY